MEEKDIQADLPESEAEEGASFSQENGAPDAEDQADDNGKSADTEEESFPRDYVEKLRQENGKYRQRAQHADNLAHRLHTELVRATGKLADPTDLPFKPEHLEDPAALTAAVEELLTAKPHLARRRPTGEIGQGATRASGTVDLAALLRQRAV